MGHIDTCNLCAIFKRSPCPIDRNLNGSSTIESIADICRPEMFANNNKYAMFVDNVELRQNPEIRGARFQVLQLCSVVRLQSLDSCERHGREQRFHESVGLPEVRLANTNGEVGISAASDVIAVKDGQLTNHVIQSGPEIVNNITSNDRPLNIVRHYFPVPENYHLPFRLMIDNKTVIVFLRSAPFIDSKFKLHEVVFSPINLTLDPNEGCNHKGTL